MKKILSFFISLSIGLGLLIWIIKLVGWQDIKAAFSIFTGWQGLAILALTFLMLLVSIFKWQVILKSQGQRLSIKQLIGPYLSGYALNYLFQMIVVGGEIVRSYVLKEKYGVPWKKAISSVAIDKILEGTAFLVAILVGLTLFLLKIGMPPFKLAFFLIGFAVFFIIVTSFFYIKCFKRQSIVRPIINFLNRRGIPEEEIIEIEKETFSYFKVKKTAFWQGVGLSFLRTTITWLRCWLLVLFLGKSIGIVAALPILSFTFIALAIPIPADLGIHETIQFFAFDALGLGAGTALAFTVIQRAAQLTVSLVGLLILFKLGISLFQTALFKKLNGWLNNK